MRVAFENRARADRLANPKWIRLRYREVQCRECPLRKMTNAAFFTCDFCKSKRANLKLRDAARRRLDGRRAPVFDRDAGICHFCLQPVRRDFRPPHPGSPAIDRFSRPDRYQLCHLRCLKEVTDDREEGPDSRTPL